MRRIARTLLPVLLATQKPEATAELLENKWVKSADSDKMFGSLLDISDPEQLLNLSVRHRPPSGCFFQSTYRKI